MRLVQERSEDPAMGAGAMSREQFPAVGYPPVQGTVEIAHANVQTTKRAGDLDRAKILDHLNWCRKAGYLTEREFRARATALDECTLKTQLTALITDLPGLVPPRATLTDVFKGENSTRNMRLLHFGGIVTSLLVAIPLPVAIMYGTAQQGNTHTWWSVLLIWSFVVFGVCGLIGSAIHWVTWEDS